MSCSIHPTAIVDATARLGDRVSVGPYAVIGPRVCVGDRSRIDAHVVLEGPLMIGEDCDIHAFAALGKRSQDLKFKGGETAVRIGDRCTIREYVTIHQATKDGGETVLGSDCVLLAYCHVAHDCVVGDDVILSNGFTLAGHVHVGDCVVGGGLSGVHQFTRIGDLSMVSAMTKVVQDVMPYCIVDGNPASLVSVNKIGLQRNGRSPEAIQAVERAYKNLFRSGLRREEAEADVEAELGDAPEVREMLDFLHGESSRGMTHARNGRR